MTFVKWTGALSALLLTACNVTGSDPDKQAATPSQSGDPLAAHDPAEGQTAAADIPDAEARPVMQAQVVLDRLGFTPGVVDGKEGMSTRNAIAGFQEASGLPTSGELDEVTQVALAKWDRIPATRVVTIPADFAAGPFQKLPPRPADQAQVPALGYESLDEKLAERFHTTVETLALLNPGGKPVTTGQAAASTAPTPLASSSAPTALFRAGQQIRVPNVGGDTIPEAAVSDPEWRKTLASLGVGANQPQAARVVVSKSKGTLKAYDASDKLIAVYTATMGSQHDPLPLGRWKINGIDKNPKFRYNPDLFWDARAGDEKAMLPPGPNGPVGVVWIDISKPHYGIHGTPHPETIGRAESHGCVRLTNWDAARLAQMVSAKTSLLFEA
jgi:lipoprotein-anchoring transpeptidase ErfK/SrfK